MGILGQTHGHAFWHFTVSHYGRTDSLWTGLKLFLFFVMFSTVSVLLPSGIVFASPGPHGNYSSMTDACAGCHASHTAQSESLLKTATVRSLCDTCHNAGYSGSIYDVEDGTVLGYGNSPAGPVKKVSEGGTAVSSHMLETTLQPPGGGTSSENLGCASCHDPHGSPNYRLFRQTVTWNGINAVVNNFTATYSTSTGSMVVNYETGSVDACTSCHPDYRLRQGGSFSSGFRHYVGVTATSPTYFTSTSIPLESDSPGGRVVCLSCHYAHGSTVTNSTSGGLSGFSSALKRLPDSALCSGCHFNKW